jgi:hypothetical protein
VSRLEEDSLSISVISVVDLEEVVELTNGSKISGSNEFDFTFLSFFWLIFFLYDG